MKLFYFKEGSKKRIKAMENETIAEYQLKTSRFLVIQKL
jgi:hypothetical protein